MGFFFDRKSQEDGCTGHHYGEESKLESISTVSKTEHPKAYIKLTSSQECQHENCGETKEITTYLVTGFDTEDELRKELLNKVDEVKADTQPRPDISDVVDI